MEEGGGLRCDVGEVGRQDQKEKQRRKANTKSFHHFLNILLASPERLSAHTIRGKLLQKEEIWVLFLCFQQHAISSRRLRDDGPIHYARSGVRTIKRIKGLEARSNSSEAEFSKWAEIGAALE